jgi:hypothetical protein
LRHVVRVASPVVAKRVSARIAATGRGTERARNQVTCRAPICAQRCEPVVEPRRVSSAEHNDDDRARNNDDDDHRTTDHDNDGAADHDNDGATTTTTDHDDDHRAPAAARADGQ